MNITSKISSASIYISQGTRKHEREDGLPESKECSMPRFRDHNLSTWLLVLPGMLLLSLFALPLLALVTRAITADFLEHVLAVQALAALRLSLITSLITVLITILAGTPLAYVLARWKFSAKSYIELLIDLPVVLPPSVAGLALLIAFGRQGTFGSFLNSLNISLPFTVAAVVIAQIFVASPLYVRAARIGFAEIDIQVEEAARAEGASQWQLFRYVMFPLAGRALTSGAILTWTRALGEFGATMLFAGNLQGVTQTMPMAIYLGFERNLGVAIALSAVLIGFSVFLLSVTRRLEQTNVH
jgi:molybdate transport system permease protein